jgi:hypothetical protein
MNVDSGAMTVGAWVNLASGASLANDTDLHDVVFKGASNGTGAYYELAIAGGANNGLLFRCSDGTTSITLTGSLDKRSSLTDGAWHYVAFVRSSTGTGTLYLDRTAVGSQAGMGLNIDSDGPLWLGRNWNGASFNGSLDEVILRTDALSATAIAKLADTDNNQLPDGWEWKWFRQLGNSATDNPDGDSRNNLQEYQNGSSPWDYYNGLAPIVINQSANPLVEKGVPDTFFAITAKITDASGKALGTAPVTFQLTQGQGMLATAPVGSATSASLSLTTNASGLVTVYYQEPPTSPSGLPCQVTVSAGSAAPFLINATSIPLTGLWQFQEGSGTTSADVSNNGYPVSLKGGYSWSNDGVGAVVFDGSTAYGEVANSDGNSPVLSGSGDMTIGAWIKVPAGLPAGSGTNIYDIVFKSGTAPTKTQPYYEFAMTDGTNNGLMFRCSGTTGAPIVVSATTNLTGTSQGQLQDGGWHYVAFVRSSGTGALYMDGALVSGKKVAKIPVDLNGNLWLGRNLSGPNFPGSIREVQLRTAPLSLAAISQMVYFARMDLPTSRSLSDLGRLKADPADDPRTGCSDRLAPGEALVANRRGDG